MEQKRETEQVPAYKAGENFIRNKEATLLALVKIIDWARAQEYKQALSHVLVENREAA